LSESDDDLELQALQRQLDDAFQTTRPRPGFDDELWLRMQARRPIWRRLQDSVTGLIDGMREAPAVPAAAVAVLLIVLVGAGIVRMSGLHLGGGASSPAAAPAQDGTGAFGPQGAPAFGPLPAPVLAGSRATITPVPTFARLASVSANGGNIYVGPATLTWAGQLTVTTSELPVFRYREPTLADADQFAVSLGAAPAPQPVQGGLGMYTGSNFTVVVIGSVTQPAREPTFNLSDTKPPSASAASDPVGVATAYLAAHSLIPAWPYQTEVQTIGTTVRVKFLRSFDLQTQGKPPLVDSVGEPYGIEVDLAANVPGAYETGPLPLNLDSAAYPIISADQAVRSALASSTPSGNPAVPVVRITKAELVYTLVLAGDHNFYEPAFLFSGTFTYHGTTYVKRLLIPAVTPAFLSH
jgi:hypothetical protein